MCGAGDSTNRWNINSSDLTERYGHVHRTERYVNPIGKHDTRGQTRDIRCIIGGMRDE